MKVLHFPGDNKLKDWYQVFTKLRSVLVEKPFLFPTFHAQCAHADTHVRKRRKQAEWPRMDHAILDEWTAMENDRKGTEKNQELGFGNKILVCCWFFSLEFYMLV